MFYREIIAVCSEIHTKHINTLCGKNVDFFTLIYHYLFEKIQAIPRSKHISSQL